MGLFEWLWERNHRNRTGYTELHKKRELTGRSNGLIIFNFILSIAVLSLPFLGFEQYPLAIPKKYLLVLILESVYILAGYYFHPKSNSSNYGWMGGLMDNPFRISDDINRALLTFKIILYPGRMLGTFIAQFLDLLFNRKEI